VLKLASALRNPFSFLFTRSTAEEQVVAYLTREHRRGRSVADIFTDRYVANRLTRDQQGRLLERPDLIHVLGEHDVAAAREIFRAR
jgi:hemerythrin-like domain-containing protein